MVHRLVHPLLAVWLAVQGPPLPRPIHNPRQQEPLLSILALLMVLEHPLVPQRLAELLPEVPQVQLPVLQPQPHGGDVSSATGLVN